MSFPLDFFLPSCSVSPILLALPPRPRTERATPWKSVLPREEPTQEGAQMASESAVLVRKNIKKNEQFYGCMGNAYGWLVALSRILPVFTNFSFDPMRHDI